MTRYPWSNSLPILIQPWPSSFGPARRKSLIKFSTDAESFRIGDFASVGVTTRWREVFQYKLSRLNMQNDTGVNKLGPKLCGSWWGSGSVRRNTRDWTVYVQLDKLSQIWFLSMGSHPIHLPCRRRGWSFRLGLTALCDEEATIEPRGWSSSRCVLCLISISDTNQRRQIYRLYPLLDNMENM